MTLDKFNSNIDDIINGRATYLNYDITAQSNPAGNVGQNFVVDTSKIEVTAEIELPLSGIAKNFVVRDTIPFEMEGLNELVEATFRINTDNGFPVDVAVQCYFLDSNDVVIDSLMGVDQSLILAGLVDSDGRVISSTHKTLDIPMTTERINEIAKMKSIVIIGRANTNDNGTTTIKLYSEYRLDVKLGLKAKVEDVLNI